MSDRRPTQERAEVKYSFVVPAALDTEVRRIAAEKSRNLSTVARDLLLAGINMARGSNSDAVTVKIPEQYAERVKALCATTGVEPAVVAQMALLRYLGDLLASIEAPTRAEGNGRAHRGDGAKEP